jgi:glutamate-1-semialdehyde 2,1-aminomutase
MYGTCNTTEVELAEQICRMVPCAKLVRYANSGSEAICGAIRAARGFTGKSKILKFEGHYHGWVDVLAVSNRPTVEQSGPDAAPFSVAHSKGIPATVVEDVVIAPWNDAVALRQILDAHAGQFAAIICEPIVANNACTMPAPGFLQTLRDECTKRGILLIFDEIVTGFRLAIGGAQEAFGVLPDIAVYSKAIGGGFPISAFAGSREVMTPIALNTVKHGGTYNGNPISAAAALATLRALARPETVQRMHEVGEALMEEITRSAKDFGVTCAVQGVGSMFQVLFGIDRPSRQYRDVHRLDMKRYAAFRDALLEAGFHSNSSGLACIFTSAAHTADDVRIGRAAIRKAMRTIA